MRILYIVPAYNCAKTLPSILSRLPQDATIVLDDGSDDGTEELVKNFGINCIRHSRRLGVGAALKTGIEFGLKSRFDYGITLDADGQHPVDKIDQYKSALRTYDFVIGNRFVEITDVPDCKLASNLCASLIVQELFSTALPDVACGFRAFKLHQSLLGIRDDGYGFLHDHLMRVLTESSTIGTVQIPCIYRYDRPLCTRRSELQGFLAAAVAHVDPAATLDELLNNLAQNVNETNDLRFSVGGTSFYAYYVRSLDAYVFQTNRRFASEFHSKLKLSGNVL